MATPATSSLLKRLRQRADALPLDRAPLRRAGLLTVLLIALLIIGKAFGPAPARSADRQDVRSATEEVSVPASSSVWTGGRVLAILFLLTGGGIAIWLHRRSSGRTVSTGSTLRVLETHTLGPGQSLQLVACGEEVLLLSVATEGATLLRHWPRATFEAEPVSFASALASLTNEEPDIASSIPGPTCDARPEAPPLPVGEGRGGGDHNELVTTEVTPDQEDERATVVSSTKTDERVELSEEHATAEPTLARGTLFPPRTHAPHQFDVRHG